MNARDTILTRVREALRTPAHRTTVTGGVTGGTTVPMKDARSVLPQAGGTFEEQVRQFQANALELKTEFVLVPEEADLLPAVWRLRDREGWRRVATHRGPLTEQVAGGLGLPVLLTDPGYPVEELERCDAGLTGCDCLVAQTGSVVVTTRSAGGRALSVLPPHHVVLARRGQLVADLPEAFERLQRVYGAAYPSMISFITGPSRTGDIERILVLGAHGPKQLTILCC